MLLFIAIFFAMIIAVSISAIAGFSVYLKRRTKSLKSENQRQFAAPPYRSLFEPSDEEIRAGLIEARRRIEVEGEEDERQILFEKSEQARDFERIWRGEPTKQNTVELLRLAALSESAATFSQTTENVLQIWRENKIEI